MKQLMHLVYYIPVDYLATTIFCREKGTMYQLRNLINRTSIPSDPSDNMNAAEDFLLLLLHTHAAAATKVI